MCISIILDEPKRDGFYGGLTAAPLFKQVAEKAANYLNIRPDLKNSEPTAEQNLAAEVDRRPLKTVSARTLENH